MKQIVWSNVKNEILKKQRGVSFEMVVYAIVHGGYIRITSHPNKEQYSHQKVYILFINNYYYYVPFVEDDEKIFLKTIIPSRKIKKVYENK